MSDADENRRKMEEWLDSSSYGFVDRQGKPVKNRDIGNLLGDADYRKVAFDSFKDADGTEVKVSTVFLGLPHIASITSGKMVLYETMIFGGAHDQWQHRWENAAVATKAHEKIVEALKEGHELPFQNTSIIESFFNLIEKADEGEEWKNPPEEN